MPIVAWKWHFRHVAHSLYNLLHIDLIVQFRYRIRKYLAFALICVILPGSGDRLLGVVTLR